MKRNYPLFRIVTLIISIIIGLLLIGAGFFVGKTIGAILIVVGIIFAGVFIYYFFMGK